MTYVFALAHLDGVAGADALAASGLDALADRYADREHGGWFASLDPPGTSSTPPRRTTPMPTSCWPPPARWPPASRGPVPPSRPPRPPSTSISGPTRKARAGELERRLHRARAVPRRQQQHALGGGVPGRGRRHRQSRLARPGRLHRRLPDQRAGPGPCLADTRALRRELAAPPGLQRRPPQRPVPAVRHHPRPFLRMGQAAADAGGGQRPPPGCSKRRPRCSTPPSPTRGSGTGTRA